MIYDYNFTHLHILFYISRKIADYDVFLNPDVILFLIIY